MKVTSLAIGLGMLLVLPGLSRLANAAAHDAAPSLLAHEDTAASGALADSISRAAHGEEAGAGERKSEPVERYKMPPFTKAIMDHLHNKLIHFPIVLTIVAAAMVIVARCKPEYEPVAFWLVWVAALSVIPAYFTGKAAAEYLEGKPKEWLAEVHEKQAITIGVLQALWILSLLRPGTRRFAWVIGVVLVIVVLSAGYIGGLLAHGH
jgi:uncharacterized membrane protein